MASLYEDILRWFSTSRPSVTAEQIVAAENANAQAHYDSIRERTRLQMEYNEMIAAQVRQRTAVEVQQQSQAMSDAARAAVTQQQRLYAATNWREWSAIYDGINIDIGGVADASGATLDQGVVGGNFAQDSWFGNGGGIIPPTRMCDWESAGPAEIPPREQNLSPETGAPAF